MTVVVDFPSPLRDAMMASTPMMRIAPAPTPIQNGSAYHTVCDAGIDTSTFTGSCAASAVRAVPSTSVALSAINFFGNRISTSRGVEGGGCLSTLNSEASGSLTARLSHKRLTPIAKLGRVDSNHQP